MKWDLGMREKLAKEIQELEDKLAELSREMKNRTGEDAVNLQQYISGMSSALFKMQQAIK